MYVNDIKEIGSIWIIDINDNEDKKLKTLNSGRKVPIHSMLIGKLKLLDYVEQLKEEGEKRLFPELKKTRDGYGDAFSKWFNRTYKRKMNVGQSGGEKKDFHSFRHSFSNYFKQLGNIEEYRVAEIIGHQSKTTSITYNRYGKAGKIEEKKKLIEQLKFEFIEFKKFRLWTTGKKNE